MSVKILITGGSGFIGTHLIDYLESFNQFDLIKVGRRITTEYESKGFQKISDISGDTNWECFLKDIKVVIHLAGLAHNTSTSTGYSHEHYFDCNYKGTLNLAKQAALNGAKRFIFLSSIGVNGPVTNGKAFNEDSEEVPQNFYAQSKLMAEKDLLDLSKKTGMEVVIIRPPLVYGANAPGNLAKLVRLINKVPLLPFGLIDNKRSFISILNLVDFISKCISHPKASNQVFLVSDKSPISVKDLTNKLAVSKGKKVYQLPVPRWAFKLAGKIFRKELMISQLIDDLEVDPIKAIDLLGWAPIETVESTMSNRNS